VASPLCKAIEGGSQIGDDLGCGPAHFLAPDEVRRIAIALSDVSEDDLRLRLDLREVDHEVVTSGDLACSLKALAALREYYVDAASRGNAILIFGTWFLLE
jgi:hypothetical protein